MSRGLSEYSSDILHKSGEYLAGGYATYPTLTGFAKHLGITRATTLRVAKIYQEFAEMTEHLRS